jgi:hypothetical protein
MSSSIVLPVEIAKSKTDCIPAILSFVIIYGFMSRSPKLDANILKIGALVIIIGFRFLIIMTHQQWNIGLHWSPGISLVTASTFPAVRQPQLTRKVPETLKYISLD